MEDKGLSNKKFDELNNLVDEFRNGNQEAFNQIYDRTHKNVEFLAYNYVNNKNDVEDIVQDVYFQVFKSLHTLNDGKMLYAWINTITYRCCMKSIKKTDISISNLEEEHEIIADLVGENIHNPMDTILKDEKNKLLLDCIHKLPKKQRETLIMRVYSEFSYKEIASQMESSQEGVRRNLKLAKKNLKGIIKDLPKEEQKTLKLYGISVPLFYITLKQMLHSMTGVAANHTASMTKLVIGTGVVAACATGVWFGVNQSNSEQVIQSQETQQVETVNEPAPIEENQTNEQSIEEPIEEPIEEIQEEPVTSEEIEIKYSEVIDDELEIVIEDPDGVDYSRVYALTKSGEKIYPLSIDETKGSLWFSAYSDDFVLFLYNKKGEETVYDFAQN